MKHRYEPLGVAMFACVMGMSALQVRGRERRKTID
jgi:hypothetical protein